MSVELDTRRAYRRTSDPAVRDKLIEQHLGLVKLAAGWMAGRLPSRLRTDDVYSAGMLGFLDAVESYDPERGVAFSAYALPRIRGSIFDDLRRLDCVPRRVRRKIREAQRAIDGLSQRLHREPTEQEIADELQIDVAEYQRLLGEVVTLLSLDASPGRDGERAPMEFLEDSERPSPLATLEVKARRVRLGQLIDGLPPRERQVLALYYLEELTMLEVGKVLGLTGSRVSQIHSSAVLRLRTALRRNRLRATDLDFTPASCAGSASIRISEGRTTRRRRSWRRTAR